MRPLRLRLEAPIGASALEALRAGSIRLVEEGEEADLVLRPARPAAIPPPRPSGPLPAILGRREAEILEYLAEGWSNGEIAEALGIGRRTVRFHLEGLYGKLGVTRRGEAVAEAYRRGLLRLEY